MIRLTLVIQKGLESYVLWMIQLLKVLLSFLGKLLSILLTIRMSIFPILPKVGCPIWHHN